MASNTEKDVAWNAYFLAFFFSPEPRQLDIKAVAPVDMPEPRAMIMKMSEN